MQLLDPSGTVFDRRSRTPHRRGDRSPAGLARSRASLRHAGNLVVLTQLNPEKTGPSGTFAWDVAPGRWRLRVTAFGYRTFVSKTYTVPPAVTGLQLQLTPIRAPSGC